MAHAVEQVWDGPLEGLCVTRYGYSMACERIEIVEAAHPVPDVAGEVAARRLMRSAETLGPDDMALCLLSGGGSSLITLPGGELTLADMQAVNAALLCSGAPIGEMNVLRRHLSAVSGGRLAAACYPARVLSLLISDVPGDRPIDIASGPTVGDPTTCADALAIARRYDIELPKAAWTMLESGAGESVKPEDPRLASSETRIVAAPQIALEAAASVARRNGLEAHILSDALVGEARDVGGVLASISRQVATRSQPFPAPCVLLSSGETTVSLRGNGRGGRNVECLLAMALELGGLPHVHALAADTDGVDGVEEVAGAIIEPDTLARASAAGLNPRRSLDTNDAHTFFEALGDQVVTGPTFTNVNDFRAVLICA